MRRTAIASILLLLAGGALLWIAAPSPPPARLPPPPEPEADEPGVSEVVVEWQTAFLEAIAESAREGERAAAPPAPPEPPPAPAPAPEPPPAAPPPSPVRRVELRGDPTVPGVLVPPPPRGELDRDTVKKAVAAVNPQVADCYRQGLRQDPTLGGVVAVRFTIEQRDGEGRITDAELDPDASTMTQPFVQACVLEALGKARFPAPETANGRQRVRYPFTLRTKKQASLP